MERILLQRALSEMGIPWREAAGMLGFSRQYLGRFFAGDLDLDGHMVAALANDLRLARWLEAVGKNAADLAGPDDFPGPGGEPTVLWAALRELGVRLSHVAAQMGVQRHAVSRALYGKRYRNMRGPLRIWLAGRGRWANAARRWMTERNIPMTHAFAPWAEEHAAPCGRGPGIGGFVPGDPDQLTTPHRRAFMITFPTMRHFKMRRNPFDNEIADVTDIFLSEDHYYIKEMMLEAAKRGGFCAVYGEVGSGKSTMRKLIYRELADADIHTIYPVILDKRRITAASLLEAIVMDLHEGGVRRTHEARTRQAIELIRHRVENGQRQVIIIEEAHLLNIHALKALKQIWEWEMGGGQWRRLVGIVLIGQPELEGKLDKSKYPQLREVIARIIPARIEGLNEVDTGRYLQHKFERSGIKPGAVIAEDAPPAIFRRLTSQNGRGIVSNAHPLAINNVAALAMNRAAEIGEPVVSGELVQSL